MLKRFQYLTKDGIEWSEWFRCRSEGDKYQYKCGSVVLLNEYKEE